MKLIIPLLFILLFASCETIKPPPEAISTSASQFSGTWAGYTPVYQQDFAEAFYENKRSPNQGRGLGLYYDKRGQKIENAFRWTLKGNRLTIIYPPKPHFDANYGRFNINFSKKVTVVYSVKWVSERHAKFTFTSSSTPIPRVRRGDVFDAFKSPHQNLDDSIEWYNDKVAAPPF